MCSTLPARNASDAMLMTSLMRGDALVSPRRRHNSVEGRKRGLTRYFTIMLAKSLSLFRAGPQQIVRQVQEWDIDGYAGRGFSPAVGLPALPRRFWWPGADLHLPITETESK